MYMKILLAPAARDLDSALSGGFKESQPSEKTLVTDNSVAIEVIDG